VAIWSKSKKPVSRATTPKPKEKRGRYTPPTPKKVEGSKLWVPVTMFTMLGLGVVVVALNYLELLPGQEASNNFLFIGLGLITGGFILSTRLK
jgi:hypothetical protein